VSLGERKRKYKKKSEKKSAEKSKGYVDPVWCSLRRPINKTCKILNTPPHKLMMDEISRV